MPFMQRSGSIGKQWCMLTDTDCCVGGMTYWLSDRGSWIQTHMPRRWSMQMAYALPVSGGPIFAS